MTDEEVRQQVERAEAFIAAFRELIAATDLDPARSCEAACRRLQSGEPRCSPTWLVVGLIEVQLKFVGKGFALDRFTDATAILEGIHRPFLDF
jgi:hypothetical protein